MCSLHVVTGRGRHHRPPYYLQLTLVLFRSQNVTPSPVALFLYADVPCWPQMNPGVHTIYLVLPRFVCSPTLSDTLNITVSFVCTQMGLRPALQPSSKYKKMLCPPDAYKNLLCAS